MHIEDSYYLVKNLGIHFVSSILWLLIADLNESSMSISKKYEFYIILSKLLIMLKFLAGNSINKGL